MTYRILFRTTDPSHPPLFAFIDSDIHVMDMDVSTDLCIKAGDLASADAQWISLSPRGLRYEAQVFVPAVRQVPSNWTEVGQVQGKANIYTFATPEECEAFCEATGAIAATMFQQSPAV